nr:unnamed protein product [Digitaria exilis]
MQWWSSSKSTWEQQELRHAVLQLSAALGAPIPISMAGALAPLSRFGVDSRDLCFICVFFSQFVWDYCYEEVLPNLRFLFSGGQRRRRGLELLLERGLELLVLSLCSFSLTLRGFLPLYWPAG